MVVCEIKPVDVNSNNVLGRNKEVALDRLHMAQDIRPRGVVKQLHNIALVRVIDDK